MDMSFNANKDHITWSNFNITSFNCKHFRTEGPKFDFIDKCALDCDIMFIQEHCLYDSELDKLSKLGGGMEYTARSSMDETICLDGRKYGGAAILWKTTMNGKFKEIICDNCRLCAVFIIMSNNITLLIMNAYMPCDGRTEDSRHAEYVEILNEVQQLMNTYSATYVLFGGDLNTDLSRDTPHSQSLSQFVGEYNMGVCTEMDIANVPYTFSCERNGNTYTSKVDHLIVSENLSNHVLQCNIIGQFHSDHAAVVTVLSLCIPHMPI